MANNNNINNNNNNNNDDDDGTPSPITTERSGYARSSAA